MDKLAPNEVSNVLRELSEMLAVARSMLCDPNSEGVGLDILEVAQQRAVKAAKSIEGVNYV
ncbi:hypothetical protein CV016_04415 [Yersinia kristensenii]|uniref:Uncharacterized protein n=1 Tax=Yersinia intermedia TaxID=631 RepID=A0A0T9MHD3_YERIN|nr:MULTISPECIES: hypothetical protein [Yersinia]EKN6273818.1 hypothetical protein [Yersinia enterocolitica]PJG63868.1 hypothetical protein CV016_04415 [Yersinia kristensenii]UYJ97973.1 hypothetical protein N4W06_02580 [Yersinia enterocolitica]CNG10573.1 Uncharacterised protein [Yersinia intermedia]